LLTKSNSFDDIQSIQHTRAAYDAVLLQAFMEQQQQQQQQQAWGNSSMRSTSPMPDFSVLPPPMAQPNGLSRGMSSSPVSPHPFILAAAAAAAAAAQQQAYEQQQVQRNNSNVWTSPLLQHQQPPSVSSSFGSGGLGLSSSLGSVSVSPPSSLGALEQVPFHFIFILFFYSNALAGPVFIPDPAVTSASPDIS